MSDKKIVKKLKESYEMIIRARPVVQGDVSDLRALKFALETLLSYYMVEKDAIKYINKMNNKSL